MPLVSLSDVPLTHGGRIGFQVENALAAAAAAWALGIPRDAIRDRLWNRSPATWKRCPAGSICSTIGGATVIVDYGHNIVGPAGHDRSHRTVPASSAGPRSTRPPATAATATWFARANCSATPSTA